MSSLLALRTQYIELMLDVRFKIIKVSANLDSFLGLLASELTGAEFATLFRLQDSQGQPLELSSLSATETRQLTIQHQRFQMRVSARLQPIEQGLQSLVLELPAQPLSEAECVQAFEQAAIGMASVSTSGRFLYVNPAYAGLLGYTREALLQLDFQQLTHPEDLENDLQHFQRLLQGKVDSYQLEKRYLHQQGHAVWVLLSVSLTENREQPPFILAQAQDISARKQQEQALLAEQQRLKATERLAQLGNWEVHLASGQVVMSDELYRICGLEPGCELPGDALEERCVHPDDRESAAEAVEKCLRTGKPYQLQKRIVRPDGEIRHVLSEVELICSGEQPSHLRRAILDITDCVRQNEALSERVQVLKGFYHSAPFMMGIVELQEDDICVLSANQQTGRFFKLDPSQLLNKTASELGAPQELIEALHALYLRSERSGQPEQLEYLRPLAGRRVCLRVVVSPIDLSKRRFCYVAEDIAHQKQLHADILRIQAALDNVSTSVMIADSAFKIVYLNPAMQQLFHETEAEIRKAFPDFEAELVLGQSMDIFHGTAVHQQELLQALQGGHRAQVQLGQRHFELMAAKAENVAGEVLGYVVEWRDITEALLAQQVLQESQARFESIFNSVFTFIGLLDTQGHILEVNQTALDATGVTLEQVLGKHLAETPWFDYAGAPKAEMTEAVVKAAAGQFIRFETEIQGLLGQMLPIDFSLRPVWDKHGEIRFLVPEGRDISDARQYSQSLKRSNRELEQFAYIASHDLQEPLRKIQAFGKRLQTTLADKLADSEAEQFQRMQKAAGRMQNLIRDLLAYSKLNIKSRAFEKVDLNLLFQEACETLELQIEEKGARLRADKLPVLMADRFLMAQLFQNLLSNALKFTAPERPPLIEVRCSYPDSKSVKMTFSDNGIGFDPRYQEQIFEVFQRLHTDAGYEGTGIGLSFCRKIVEQHKGQISAISAVGLGTQFIILLPLDPRENT